MLELIKDLPPKNMSVKIVIIIENTKLIIALFLVGLKIMYKIFFDLYDFNPIYIPAIILNNPINEYIIQILLLIDSGLTATKKIVKIITRSKFTNEPTIIIPNIEANIFKNMPLISIINF